MNRNALYVLIHSPLVGPLTWSLVAGQMRRKGRDAVVPVLYDSPDPEKPFWRQHAESVSQALAKISHDTLITLVAHSGAGPLLPVIRETLVHPVRAYVFVDAGIPWDGATRLDLMRSEDPEWAKAFQEYLEGGRRFPNWSAAELRETIPDKTVRQKMVTELRPRALSFFTEPLPVFEGWPDAHCLYILFSKPYERVAIQAQKLGWPTYLIEAGHFHMLVDPKTVTDLILKAVNDVQ
jgi:hypothetical protein